MIISTQITNTEIIRIHSCSNFLSCWAIKLCLWREKTMETVNAYLCLYIYIYIYIYTYIHITDILTYIHTYKQGQYFLGIFWTIWRTGDKFQVLFNLATCYNYSITNYIKIPIFYFLKKVNKGHLKMVNVNIKNGQILIYCHFNKIIKGPETSFQSQNWAKNMLEMFLIQYTSIWPNFILIVLMIKKK